MATRTFKMNGFLTEGTADITVTFNSTQVFTGSVDNTSRGEPLLTFTADTSVSGDITTTVVNNSGNTVYIGPLDANYIVYEGQTYTDDDSVEQTYSTTDVTSKYEPMNEAKGNSMKSVQIDGEEASVSGTESTGWVPVPVEAGETLSCSMVVDAIASA